MCALVLRKFFPLVILLVVMSPALVQAQENPRELVIEGEQPR